MASGVTPDSLCPLAFLEYFPEPGGLPQRVALRCFPFSIGRDPGAHLAVSSRRVSQAHAVITCEGEDCYIHDMHSTNGTFVNGRRVEGGTPLVEGDIVHLAHVEFRFGYAGDRRPPDAPLATEAAKSQLPPSFIRAHQYLSDMIAGRMATALFQPIVRLSDRQVVGYESLGRGRHEQLPDNPGLLLELAGRCGLAADLSEMLREQTLAEAARLPSGSLLFLNLHPAEMRGSGLLRSLGDIPAAVRAARPLVLEVHEDAVADVPVMRRLRDGLRELDIRLAYDDFGAGQARLAELAAVPPDFVKLDRNLVQNLPHSGPLQDLVRTLSQVSAGMSCSMIAEGVETEVEVEACRALGCQFAQGYLFGRPQRGLDISTPSLV